MNLIEHPISVSQAQLRKLKMGGAVTLNKSHFVRDAPHSMLVMANTDRRIGTAMRKNKGVRVALKPEEDLVAMTTEGGKISMKSIGRTFKKGADVVKRGFDKTIVDSGVGKEIARNLIDIGTATVLPTALGAASMALGDPTGMSGQMAGQVAGKYINQAAAKQGYGVRKIIRQIKAAPVTAEEAIMGKGLFKSLRKIGANKVGINKKSVQAFGKVVLREGAKAAGEALTTYTGNPMLAVALEKIAVDAGDKLIDTGSLKAAGKSSMDNAKRFGAEVIDNYIDENLTGVNRDIAQKALAGKYPTAKDLIYDYGNSKLEEMVMPYSTTGYGIPRRTRGGLRMGGAIPYFTPPYIQAMRYGNKVVSGADREIMGGASPYLTPPYIQAMRYGSGFTSGDGRNVMSYSAPSIIQTGSPFIHQNSPAMSPFIGASPQLAGKIGGSFLPAGTRGGSFNPAG
jgi:hypothetical protein